jgi:hypothetical protein
MVATAPPWRSFETAAPKAQQTTRSLWTETMPGHRDEGSPAAPLVLKNTHAAPTFNPSETHTRTLQAAQTRRSAV